MATCKTICCTLIILIHAVASQGRIHGYLYNIQNDTDFSERIISPSPERQSSPPYHPPRASRWGPNPSAALSYLDSFAPPSHSANPSQSHSEHLQRWHNTAQHYFGNSSQQLNSGSGNSTTIRPSHSSRHQASNSAAASREPRPYYYRVQQQMQAGLANHGQHRCTRDPAYIVMCIHTSLS